MMSLKVVKIAIILVVILPLACPVASAQAHPGEDSLEIIWREIAVKQVDENKLKIEENFALISRTENLENMFLMVDRDVQNLEIEENLEENYWGGAIYVLLLRDAIRENQKITIHVQYDLFDRSFRRPVWYPSDDTTIHVKTMKDFVADNSIPLGRPFPMEYSDEIKIQFRIEERPSSSSINYSILVVIVIVVVLSVAVYARKRKRRPAKSQGRESDEGKGEAIERLKRDLKRGRLPEKVYREIRSELEDETNE